MATTEEVKKLAALARIRIEDTELDKFTREFDAILAYVGQLDKLNLSGEKETKPLLRNVMRKDGEPNAPGMYTKKIVEQFPESANNALIVKQIISHEEAE
jgi:aspartyl-tRNA(Asn)/glutamyl-tRNA(Gln) amidotransferase subunit C